MKTIGAWIVVLVLSSVSLGAAPAQAQTGAKPGEFSIENPPEVEKPLDVVELPAEEDARYWKAIRQIAEAFNAEDRKAFLAAFSQRLIDERAAANDRIEGAVDFMSRAMARRGNIAKFHQLSPGLRQRGDSGLIRTVVFYFEDGMTGYFGVGLDDEGKVDEFSYFIMPGLCDSEKMCAGDPTPLAELPVS